VSICGQNQWPICGPTTISAYPRRICAHLRLTVCQQQPSVHELDVPVFGRDFHPVFIAGFIANDFNLTLKYRLVIDP
jgi:hypothetical protein